MSKSCSVIIRTFNEERWIVSCLTAVYSQIYKDFEVIIVDNESTDKTIEKAQQFPIDQILTCKDFFPGKALNIGINASKGNYIVCLSGHCIPVDDNWLKHMVDNLKNPIIACAYGRQEPMSFSADADKRDLELIFGLDPLIQTKNSFFHNANSILKRELWEVEPFDEKTTNIEDRIWAEKILKLGYKIAYDPLASVYHYHGIHQNGDPNRCKNVVRILESLKKEKYSATIDIKGIKIVAFIPAKGPNRNLAGSPLIKYTIDHVLESKYIDEVFVLTDDQNLAEISKRLGASVPFLRPPSLSKDYVGLSTVYKYCLNKIEEIKIFPDFIVTVEPTFPFRSKYFIDKMIKRIISEGLDTIIAAQFEVRSLWQESSDGNVTRLDGEYVPRKYKDRTYVGIKGLGCVTHAEYLRKEKILGDKVGLFEVDNRYSSIEVRSDEDFRIADHCMKDWIRYNE